MRKHSCRYQVGTKSFKRTELLLDKGYDVHGIIRRSSSFNTGRLQHLYEDQHEREYLTSRPCILRSIYHRTQAPRNSTCTTEILPIAQIWSTLSHLFSHQRCTIWVRRAMSRFPLKWQNIRYVRLSICFQTSLLMPRRSGGCRWPRYASSTRCDPYLWAGEIRALLPSVHLRTLWQGRRDTSVGDNTLLSAFSIWSCKTLCILDYGQLSGGIRHVCLQWDPLQP